MIIASDLYMIYSDVFQEFHAFFVISMQHIYFHGHKAHMHAF